MRLRHRATGVVVNVSDATAARLGAEWGPLTPGGPQPARPYTSWTVAQLRDEIRRRNTQRTDLERLPTSGTKADLVAALERD